MNHSVYYVKFLPESSELCLRDFEEIYKNPSEKNDPFLHNWKCAPNFEDPPRKWRGSTSMTQWYIANLDDFSLVETDLAYVHFGTDVVLWVVRNEFDLYFLFISNFQKHYEVANVAPWSKSLSGWTHLRHLQNKSTRQNIQARLCICID